MNYVATLISVKDIEVSKAFYQNVLGQKIEMDIGVNVSFVGGIALQQGYEELAGIDPATVRRKSNTMEYYFEEPEFDAFLQRLQKEKDIEYVHGVKEYPWGQHVVRFYDPDGFIIEVAEPMDLVVKRFLSQGMCAEDVAKRTMYPLKVVEQFRSQM